MQENPAASKRLLFLGIRNRSHYEMGKKKLLTARSRFSLAL